MEKEIRINVSLVISEENGVYILGTRERDNGESRVSKILSKQYLNTLETGEEVFEVINEVVEDVISSLVVNN